MMLGLQEAVIMGAGCPSDAISPRGTPEICVDGGGGVLEHQELMVHHTSPRFS
jgi:hypothetical protein